MLRLFTSLLLASSSLASIVETLAELPNGPDYDFIVIGGGTAGNVVANRLTENPRTSVLVLEAGASHENVFLSKVPFLWTSLWPNTPWDWNYTTTPQTALKGRQLQFPRGHILGGSSSINTLLYTRGSSEDYDGYAKLTGDEGWSWKNLKPYILKNEIWTEPADHHNTTGQFDPTAHGFNGMLSVSAPAYPQAVDDRITQATHELSEEFPFNLDTNSGYQLGIGWHQSTVLNGMRSSSATSYLAPEYAGRPNLHVLLHAQVIRLHQAGPKSFRNVEFITSDGRTHRLTAKKEIILSAGAVNTPHILVHSGIGDEKEISALGIKPLVNLPSVGKNLTDHPYVTLSWYVNETETLEPLRTNQTRINECLETWNATHTGPFADNPLSHVGWLRLPKNDSIWETNADPASGPNTGHYEMLFFNGFNSMTPPPGNFMSISPVVASPLSRGSVSWNNSDPLAAPLVDLAFMTSPLDMYVMRYAIRSTRRFSSAPVWNNYITKPYHTGFDSDEQIDEFIRDNILPAWHAVGTAAMTGEDASWGVVNPDLKVKGVKGLRIVDASIFPKIPTAHTQAATYAVAERAADIIKAAY